MRKIFLFLAVAISVEINAQFTSYSKYDIEYDAVFQVEDLSSYEIKMYNSFIKDGCDAEQALVYLNAARVQDNLISSPATIIEYGFSPEITESDSIPDAVGACNVEINLLNTSPKRINEVTFTFGFKNSGSPVYDIKTGDEYCTLKFTNLTGRTKSNKYVDIVSSIYKCNHFLTIGNASYKKLFYNKKASTIYLKSIFIKYEDGSSSTKAAIYNEIGSEDSLFKNGPLKPIRSFLNRIAENKEAKDRNALYHTVQYGDTLESIAHKYNTTVEYICKKNHIGRYTILTKGMMIFVK